MWAWHPSWSRGTGFWPQSHSSTHDTAQILLQEGPAAGRAPRDGWVPRFHTLSCVDRPEGRGFRHALLLPPDENAKWFKNQVGGQKLQFDPSP